MLKGAAISQSVQRLDYEVDEVSIPGRGWKFFSLPALWSTQFPIQ